MAVTAVFRESVIDLSEFGTLEDANFRAGILGRHSPVSGVLASQYRYTARREGYAAANIQLRQEEKNLKLGRTGLFCHASDEQIKDYARVKSRNMERDFTAYAKRFSTAVAVDWARGAVLKAGLDFPLKDKDANDPAKQLSCIARVCCERWWRRKLRTMARRQLEQWLRERGQVCKQRSAYVSKQGLAGRSCQKKRNAQLLLGLEAVADTGEVVNLGDAAAAGVSNPANRRTELMVRMRGFEEMADCLGLQGEFLTLTCPSAFHPVHHKGGKRNHKYNGTTPREAQDYLCMVWANIRAAWAKEDIKAFGFRIAEPHHCGTPHWHLLLFFRPSEVDRAWEIFNDHALRQDGNEAGAAKYRAERVTIDPDKGTAAGYIAKYVSKNIDGFALDNSGGDHEAGTDALEGAQRVDAWAGIWGIRQFQQIGSTSVTVWREFRRVREALPDDKPEVLEAIRVAADSGDWCEFIKLMGGAFVRRDGQTVRAWMVEREGVSRYAEAVERIRGVLLRGVSLVCSQVQTRTKNWAIRRVGGDQQSARSKGFESRGP